jgi:lipoyl(octanoyl) transferase
MLERVDLGEIDYDEARTRMAGWVKECREGIAGDRLFLLSHPRSSRTARGRPPATCPPTSRSAALAHLGAKSRSHPKPR